MLSDLKPTTLAAIASLVACVVAKGADATRPIDYTLRNETLAPGGGGPLPTQNPPANAAVQDKRVEPPTIDKRTAPLRGREAALEVRESREKRVREKDPYPVEVREQPTSAFNHRPAAIGTSADAIRPPRVAKYQESLQAASAANMARFRAGDRASSATINRFIFRRNPAGAPGSAGFQPAFVEKAGRMPALLERGADVKENPAFPAAGGSALKR